ncbi:N-myristoyl transferase [Macrolepiota fuliginosa MF-IS2]|uniref:Glycylpeptide N-tetradecanoyltransferase n=1 Tax=Macrolepiota fuliginosa MF-IS2 TaxID=1400762 RepID=A0A9P5XND8_9AGAR|nr:N-myristoyl transferase [Macrolepiota fuliginosa MF-IS2]
MASKDQQKQPPTGIAPAEEHEEEEQTDSEDEPHDPDQAVGSSTTALASDSKKKKKKKSKVSRALSALKGKSKIPDELVNSVLDRAKAEESIPEGELTPDNIRDALEQLKIMDVVQGKVGLGGLNKKDMGAHKFWGTQPVPQPGEGPPIDDGYIEPTKPREEVRQEPYPLHKDFEWSFLDISDPKQCKEVYDLLSANYVEDDQASFRFQYSAEFLQWALMPPGYHKEWHIGVRVTTTKKLVAFISGVPMTLRVRKNVINVTEINYLCVHKRLRSKRLAPVLIKEVTRQTHLKGIFQAIYTAGVIVPTPISTCRYFHRSLNVPKLVDIGFCYVPRNMTLARMTRLNAAPGATVLPGLREMEEKDILQVASLFTRFMQRFSLAPIYDIGEIQHQFLSGRGEGSIGDGGQGRRERQVTWSYVVEDPGTQQITDFFSFYSLPSTVIGNQKHPVLEAAYLYYYATTVAFEPGAEGEEGHLKRRLETLITDALVVANDAKFDVFNALTLMDNVSLLQDLKFGPGDGYLNFYLYNWRTAPLSGMNAEADVPAGKGIGVVML